MKDSQRAFLGLLRGEPKHCSMAAFLIEEQDVLRVSLMMGDRYASVGTV